MESSVLKSLRYWFMKDLGASGLIGISRTRKRRRPSGRERRSGPPLASTHRLKEIMARHYLLSRYAEGAKPVAWVTSGAPVMPVL